MKPYCKQSERWVPANFGYYDWISVFAFLFSLVSLAFCLAVQP